MNKQLPSLHNTTLQTSSAAVCKTPELDKQFADRLTDLVEAHRNFTFTEIPPKTSQDVSTKQTKRMLESIKENPRNTDVSPKDSRLLLHTLLMQRTTISASLTLTSKAFKKREFGL
jgi:hypothetical protein